MSNASCSSSTSSGELDDLFMPNSTLEENELVTGDVAAFSVEADLGQ